MAKAPHARRAQRSKGASSGARSRAETETVTKPPAESELAQPANRTGATGARRPARSDDERRRKLGAILDAALDVFSDKGFADAKLDAIAARAGVAKGTLYLYVSSKDDLLERLIRTGIALPIEEAKARILALDAPAEELLRMLFAFLRIEVLGTRRKEIARMVLAEAARHPAFAEFYYREVVSRGLALLREIAERGVARGEFRSDALVRFPQLILAPAVVAILWSNLFERFAPLDVEAMLDAHLGLLMRAVKEPAS
jgi:AcrR family transcriptional regulator